MNVYTLFPGLFISLFSQRQPNRLSVVLSRRSRRVVSEPLPWEPTMKDPLVGNVVWPIPDNKEITITLFKNQRTNEFEDKEWAFLLEDVSNCTSVSFFYYVFMNLVPNFHSLFSNLSRYLEMVNVVKLLA